MPHVRERRRSDFKTHQEIQRGAFGRIFTVSESHKRGSTRTSTSTHNGENSVSRDSSKPTVFALKEIDMSKFTLRQESQALREAKLMKSFNHPYILNFIETFISDDKLFILMDFAEGGSLADFVKKSSRPIPCKTVVMWFTQLLLAVYYLHERKIIHRDIKCQNILIMGSGKIVLADFGVSRVLDNTMALATTMVGTPLSMAPEVYKGKSYSTQSDMWSYGIVIYEVCARTVPFQAKSFAEVRQKVLRDPEPSLPRDYKVVRDIYLSCLQKDPHKRATAKDLLNDSTIQSVIRTMKKKKK